MVRSRSSPRSLEGCGRGRSNANEERGVYRTRDGGTSWEKVLYIDENTGCSDLRATSEEGIFSADEKLREHLGALYGAVSGYTGRPTDSELRRKELLLRELVQAEPGFSELTSDGRLGRINSELGERELEPLQLMSREDWEERRRES